MKLIHLAGGVLLLTAPLLIASCSDSRTSSITDDLHNKSTIEFVSFSDTSVVDLPSIGADLGQPSYGWIIHEGIFPTKLGNHDLTPLHDALMELAFNTVQPTIQQAIDYSVKHTALAEEGDSVAIATRPLQPDSAVSEERCVITIQNITETMLSFAVNRYTYMAGAAHGGSGTTYLNYFLPTSTILTEANVFDANSRNDIIAAIREAASEQYPAGSNVEADAIDTFDNFYITPLGNLAFVYGQYAIAPYSAGEVEITVAPYEIYDYLTPLGKEIFGF